MNKNENNKNENNKNENRYSWNALQIRDCRFPTKTKRENNIDKVIKITLEEAITWPNQNQNEHEKIPLEYLINTGKGFKKYNLLSNITGLRIQEMNENNVLYHIISPTAAGVNGLKAKTKAEQVKKAQEVNNYMHDQMLGHEDRLKAFCSLPMRDPEKAAIELERAIKELGMVGALVNGHDILPNEGKALFYDTLDYDVLWKKFEELDVPLYLHPTFYSAISNSFPDDNLLSFYNDYPQLAGSAYGFTSFLAQHMLRLILSGIFDRFPKLKIILGHMGELLPWIADRFDHRLCVYKNQLKEISNNKLKSFNLKKFYIPKLTLSQYLRKNIYITTSGWFSDDALEFVIKKVGIDRVLFSIDSPYEKQSIACEWIDNAQLSKSDKEKVAYKNAAKLLKLNVKNKNLIKMNVNNKNNVNKK